MTDQEKREMLKRIFEPLHTAHPMFQMGLNYDALADQAIVEPVEVEHSKEWMGGNLGCIDEGTWLLFEGGEVFVSPKFIGTPGPDNVAIILPYPKGEEEE